MWIWLCMIAGIILGIIFLLPESQVQPSTDVDVETTVLVSLVDELDDWDREDQIEELEDEVLLYYDEEDEGLLDDESE